MENPALPVVCALIERAGRVLLAKRPAHKHLALKWEFPGGKVDPGESAEAALIREIREELLCDIIIRRALPRIIHTYDRTMIEMIPFVCSLSPESPDPQPSEHVAIAWALPAELAAYDLAAADLPIARMYQAEVSAGSPKST
jgi:8-oxo-dGTP diphosphatase